MSRKAVSVGKLSGHWRSSNCFPQSPHFYLIESSESVVKFVEKLDKKFRSTVTSQFSENQLSNAKNVRYLGNFFLRASSNIWMLFSHSGPNQPMRYFKRFCLEDVVMQSLQSSKAIKILELKFWVLKSHLRKLQREVLNHGSNGQFPSCRRLFRRSTFVSSL